MTPEQQAAFERYTALGRQYCEAALRASENPLDRSLVDDWMRLRAELEAEEPKFEAAMGWPS